MTVTTDLLTLAREARVTPARCGYCFSRSGGWGAATTDGDPASYVMWQCQGCGSYAGRDRAGLLAMIRRQRDAEVTR